MNTEWTQFARVLGLSTCLPFDPRLLVPEQRIRDFCYENKCGNYDNHHMCPPRIGSLEESKGRLGTYNRGIILQYSRHLDVMGDRGGRRRSKLEFHEKVLQFEELLSKEGVKHPWGLIGGSCGLCDVCRAREDEPCPYPEMARTSLEALGVDVLALLEGLGLDNKFYPDKITWTGCILY